MGTRTTGFTIIETMLFLAVSGLLIMAMLATTGASINIQRYRDAVETFKMTVLNQYNALTNVQNGRDDNWSCQGDASTTQGGIGTLPRGQSNCVLLGRYMTVVDNQVTIHSVLGREAATVVTTGDDIEKLKKNYTLNISTVSEESRELEWGTSIAWAKQGDDSRNPTTPRSIGILFIRSPDSGQMYTFTDDTVPTEVSPAYLETMLVAKADVIPGQRARTICIESNGLFVTADQSIYLAAAATGPSSVETRSNSIIESLGGSTRC